MTMNRVATLAVGIMLVVGAPHLLAQHGGHGGGGRRGTPGTGGDTSDTGLTDFNRALAVQATADQAAHFQELLKNTENARKLAQELAAAKPDSATDSSRKSAALKDAVEEAQGGNQDFMKSFTKSQKAGLKELTKKLEKADARGGQAVEGIGAAVSGEKRRGRDCQYGRQAGESAGGISKPASRV